MAQAFGEFEFAASGPKQAFPSLSFSFEAGHSVLNQCVVEQTTQQAKVEPVGHAHAPAGFVDCRKRCRGKG